MNNAVNLAGDSLIVLTRDEYETLVRDAGDIALADAAAGGPTLPGDLLAKVLAGELHPLAAWRKAAGLSQGALAEKAGQRAATISDIESRKIDPRLSTVKALAEALGVEIDNIVE